MGLFDKRKTRSEASPKAVVAAAVALNGPAAVAVAKASKPGTEDWQKEAWYHYDACGEFRAAVTWIANAVSKAEPVALEIDPDTGEGTPSDDARAQAAALTVFGGTTLRGQALKTLAVHWQVPGESFIVIHPGQTVRGVAQPDRWLIVSGPRMIYKGGSWQYQDPFTLQMVTLTPQDRLIRVWAPHPNDGAKADSAARPALPILREIERASQHIMAVMESRLSTAGVWTIPSETEFPREEGQGVGEALSDYILQAAETGIRTPGAAAARVPLIVTMPGDQVANQNFQDFSSAFDAAVVELRTNGLGRLASTLDMPNETAEGSTGGMNHWGAWQVEESTYKIFIEPLLEMIGDAITREWYHPALRAMGVTDPDRFVIGWNTAGIVSRPDRTGELKELWDDVLISNEYRLAELGVPEDAMPDEAEKRRRELFELVKVAPTLLADPVVGAELFGFEIAPAAVAVDPAAATVEAGEEAPTPELPAAPNADERPDDEVPEGLVAAAELIVYDALSRAGGRLLTREHRGQFGHVAKHELHTVIPVTDVPRLLEGSFAFTDRVAGAYGMDQGSLDRALQSYVKYCLASGERHDHALLTSTLRVALR